MQTPPQEADLPATKARTKCSSSPKRLPNTVFFRNLLSNLALGVEVFGQGPDTTTDHGSAAVGVGAIFDFNDLWHLVGSANTGISNAGADQFSFNLALKWTP